ncbi:aminodeoxychorismate synthase component I [Corynebacterium sp. TAE3-ERU12]|uniref:aminodeoxychorismate synthase component I n=1 Tax=Corynebacterium sp. TAE3-ERU12 TaxID=2849491 RepID=UPI001C438583|nr:aminodeoxychorismate synthase component I [Corynebacterium sp. TAE3-ERU12]MBV7295476.1 aminodeoxychorismate synthase component I [Corynebacterium sp. TAE3-ERU12]
MRVLLIDNHDSFSYNVAHDIAVVTGAAPEVIVHDNPPVAPGEVDQWLRCFDAIVVSPGPGTPDCAADLGVSAAAIAQSEVPVLGICLGMQAIAHDAGVSVIRAPRPVHGEVAEVRHDGGGLFAGLASPVPMVRYHSLIVDPRESAAHEDIVVDALVGDIVMGLHRRSRPQWGLQAHPESICSHQGRSLLERFFDCARQWNQQHRRGGSRHSVQSSGAASVPLSSGTRPHWQVLVQRVAVEATSEAIVDEIFRQDDHAWWLDSATGTGVSICGSAAGPLAKVATALPDGVRVRGTAGSHDLDIDLVDLVESTLGSVAARDLDGTDIPPESLPFVPGWVGYLGYEYACRWLDPHTHIDPGTSAPPAELVFSDRVVVIDDTTAWVLALTDESVAEEQYQWVGDTAERIRTMRAQQLPLPPAPECGEVTVRHSRDDYIDLIEQCQEEIAAGQSYELCLTNSIRVRARTDSWQLYRRLRTLCPRPFAAYLAFGDHHVLSASPERFLTVDPLGQVEAKPIKGTSPRAANPHADARLAAELHESVKERAENLMIVDLLRHDLSRVCTPGSVEVPLLFDIESHAGAHQMVSTIRGTLTKTNGALDAVRATLPGGSMTGAPKYRTVQLLREFEDAPRGVYSGVLGYISVNGGTDLSIVIRTILHHADHVEYGVGGAITARSNPTEEWEETRVKARTLGVALGIDLDEELERAARY